MNKKIITTSIIILIVVIFLVYRGFIKEEEIGHTFEKVIRGAVSQEVSETGTVKTAEEISLNFQSSGRIEKIYAKIGQNIKAGQNLAKIETDQLEIQLSEAQAILKLSEAKLNRLLAGTSQEEIALAETAVANAEIAVSGAKQNLEDVKTKTISNLNQIYEDALAILNTTYLNLYNTFNTVSAIQRAYFTRLDQEGLRVREKKNEIESALNSAKSHIEIVKKDSQESIETALIEMKNGLIITANALGIIRDICETPFYRNLVANIDKTSLDAQRANINTALTSVVNSQQTITSTKLTNEANINTAQAKLDSVEGQIQGAKNTLAIKRAGARQEDINIHNAQIKQSQAKVNFLEKQLEESILKSPIDGMVTQINKKPGEMVQIVEPVISIVSVDDFQIEVNIYEEDIVKIKIGNSVDIMLVAFPDKIFKGKVISIDPTEKLIGGVVYYQATIGFEEGPPKEVKPGMTADIVIKTAHRENVLIISDDAIQEENGKFIVQVFKDGLIQDRVIEVGLRGADDMIEVVSGLQEGEKVIK